MTEGIYMDKKLKSEWQKIGLEPSDLQRFTAALEASGLRLHALLLSSDEMNLAELYSEVSGPEVLHRLYSVSKSVTALAVGCLAEEGKLSLDAPILDYFPEYEAEAGPYLRSLTIRQMLRMESCHSKTTYKIDLQKPWLESFFLTEGDHAPGCLFMYDTSASHTLAALAERLSGQKILDYLRGRGLREKGFSDEAYFLEDPQGLPIGGSGLMAKAGDLALLARLVMQGGGGVFPEDFCREMCLMQSLTAAEASFPEEAWGYGYQCWRHRKGWAFYGMGGQMAIAVPERRLILACLGDLRESKALMQRLYDLFFDVLLGENKMTGGEAGLSLPDPARLTGSEPKAMDLRLEEGNSRLNFTYNKEQKGFFALVTPEAELSFSFELGGRTEILPERMARRALVSASCHDGRQFYFHIQCIGEEVGTIKAALAVSDAYVCLKLDNNIERGLPKLRGLWTWAIKEE